MAYPGRLPRTHLRVKSFGNKQARGPGSQHNRDDSRCHWEAGSRAVMPWARHSDWTGPRAALGVKEMFYILIVVVVPQMERFLYTCVNTP